MAEGVLAQEACRAEVAVANTGLAGPPPGRGSVVPGAQCFAWSYRRRRHTYTFCETRVFSGDRNTFRHAGAVYALSRVAHYFDQAVAASAGRPLPGY
jgi:nicotinamide-nucleotide amidase